MNTYQIMFAAEAIGKCKTIIELAIAERHSNNASPDYHDDRCIETIVFQCEIGIKEAQAIKWEERVHEFTQILNEYKPILDKIKKESEEENAHYQNLLHITAADLDETKGA